MTDDWTTQGDLFTPGGGPVGPADGVEAFRPLADRLPSGLRLGTSSWSFPGWAGIVYDRAPGQSLLSRHGLPAYARHPLHRTVCVDRSYYGPLERSTWRRWAEQVPDDFRFVIKADRALTWPEGTPDGRPPGFLDPELARRTMLDPALGGLGGKLAVVLLQFPPMRTAAVGGARRFAESLHAFLRALPVGPPTWAVEIRTPGLLTEAYRDVLVDAGATHGHVVHPRAPTLEDQLALLPPGQGGLLVLRWMLRPDLGYEAARDLYHPFDRLQDPDPETRGRIAGAVVEATDSGAEAFVIANNKAEGSSPLSLQALARLLARRDDEG